MTDIGNFERPKEPKKDVTPESPALGGKAIKDFIAGKDVASLLADSSVTKVPEVKAEKATAAPISRETALVGALDELAAAPELTYDQKLELYGLSKEQALEILDSVFTKGFYEKEYKISGNINVTLRTRIAEDQDRLLVRIEAESPQFPAFVSNLVSKYNLAASLRVFKERDFAKDTFKERYDYVCLLPDIVFRLLCVKLSRFDQMMLDVMDEGAIENF